MAPKPWSELICTLTSTEYVPIILRTDGGRGSCLPHSPHSHWCRTSYNCFLSHTPTLSIYLSVSLFHLVLFLVDPEASSIFLSCIFRGFFCITLNSTGKGVLQYCRYSRPDGLLNLKTPTKQFFLYISQFTFLHGSTKEKISSLQCLYDVHVEGKKGEKVYNGFWQAFRTHCPFGT